MPKVITLNQTSINKFNLKTIESVKDFLEGLNVIPLVISAERSSVGYNYHYHIMSKDYSEDIERNLWLSGIYNDNVINEVAYYDYIIKEGNFKLFNGYEPPFKQKNASQYELMLNDIYINNVSMQEIRLKYPVLFVRHYNTISKMYELGK